MLIFYFDAVYSEWFITRVEWQDILIHSPYYVRLVKQQFLYILSLILRDRSQT